MNIMSKTVAYSEDEGLNDSFDAIWEAHMAQLEPCSICGRTFFPERYLFFKFF